MEAENDVLPKDISIAAANISRYADAVANSSCQPSIVNAIKESRASMATIQPNDDTYAVNARFDQRLTRRRGCLTILQYREIRDLRIMIAFLNFPKSGRALP